MIKSNLVGSKEDQFAINWGVKMAMQRLWVLILTRH